MIRTIPAGKFKAQCLKLIDEVAATGEPLIVTKRGVTKVRIVPDVKKPKKLIGCLAGQVWSIGDIVSPIDGRWDAVAGDSTSEGVLTAVAHTDAKDAVG